MANELTTLPKFTRDLFRQAFMILPWFTGNNSGTRFKVDHFDQVIRIITALKENKPRFFGDNQNLTQANDCLEDFYKTLKPDASPGDNTAPIAYYSLAWKRAWQQRSHFQFRGHEIKLMKYFYEIFSGDKHVHIPELLSMARLIDKNVVAIARLVSISGRWSAKTAFHENNKQSDKLRKKLFADEKVTAKTSKLAEKKQPKLFKEYKDLLKSRKHAAHIRIIEIFDENQWFTTVDSTTLRAVLKNEALDEFLPPTYVGRLGTQPTGYPLTFYTTQGLELEKPPLNEVEMNENYGKYEDAKQYKIHPIQDGTFYCQSKAVVGDSKVKYYTFQYKRRARKIKYDKVNQLAEAMENIRKTMLRHINSPHRDTWVRALMCMVIDEKYARIGNLTSTKAKNKTYGITTWLTEKHVHPKDDRIIIKYKGKHDQLQKHVFSIKTDAFHQIAGPAHTIIAKKLFELTAENNENLFTREDGKPFTPQQVNEYFTASTDPDPENNLPQGGAGAPCTVHNLRNYHATRIFNEFAEDFARHRDHAEYDQVLIAYQGRAKTKTKPAVTGITEKIAQALGNTPAICRKSYIDPKAQLMFFRRWGHRPPDALTRDLFVVEEADTYGIDSVIKAEPPKFAQAEKRSQTARKRNKKFTAQH